MKSRWFFIGMIIAALLIWKGFDVSANAKSDAQRLLSLSDRVMEGNKKVLIKQFSPYSTFINKEDFAETAAELSTVFGLPVNHQLAHEADHLAYKTTKTLHDVVLSLLYTGTLQDRSAYLVLSLETDSETGLAHILELQQELEQKMASLNMPVQWNVMVQGELRGTRAAAGEFLQRLPQLLNAAEVERYTDNGTVSVSYFSRDLKARLLTGERQMNLQAAVHEHSDTGKQRVTLGVPVITMEY
ncbi:YwmB family TATA-box binding protein [Paenibacillus naphthalenovorans]|uniref:YwmB family TATA-box binding protein n=1 Tax=Paenibacillus naphthalenovorans TaxID=162209 RepID=UPI003D2D7FC0